MSWFFRAHFLCYVMFSLNAGGRVLVLPQLNVTGLVDSPWESFLRNGWGMGWQEVGETGGGEGERTAVGM